MKRILGFLAAALLATAALGAEVTTSGLLGVSGETGLVDGATVSDQTITFKPTANGGAILILGYDDSTNAELYRHMIPVKSLQLNAANPIFQLKAITAVSSAVSPAGDKRLAVYSNGRTIRTEFAIVGKVSGAFGGATVDGLGDGSFIWTASTASSGTAVVTIASATAPGFANGWLKSNSYQSIVDGSGHAETDTALCTHICGNPTGASDNQCANMLSARGDACVAACNCHLSGGGYFGTCGTATCDSGTPGGGGG